MKKFLIPVMLLLISAGVLYSNVVKVVAWGAFTSSDENKFLEDLGLRSSLGISDLWIGSETFSLSGYYLPNHNADLRLSSSIGDKWRLTARFSQYRKWWDTSAGHEKTPGRYSVADWIPNTNTITPLSDRDDLHTTRRMGSAQLNYLVTPLQKLSIGYSILNRDGNLTPFFRGFTFVGDVPLAATAASIRNYDSNGQEAILKGNFAVGNWFMDLGGTWQSWDNVYTNSLGTYGNTDRIGLTEMADDFSTNVLHAHARLGGTFNLGGVFGAFTYSRLKGDPSNSLTEKGTNFAGTRNGAGKVTMETTRWQLGFTLKLPWRISLFAAASRMNRSKEGSYMETRTDFPAVLNSDSSRDVSTNRIRTRVRFLFPSVRLELYARYTSREMDRLFSSTITESVEDKALIQDLTLNHDEWREGVRASLRLEDRVRLTLNLEAYQQKNVTDLRDLTWGYYPGDADTSGLDGSYRLSLASVDWQFYFQGSFQRWDRDLAAPFFDPIYDPTQLFEETATEGRVQQHILTAATQVKRTIWNARFGYIQEKFSIQDPFVEFNYQPVEYDLKGILYGLGGVLNGRTWSFAWDANLIDTTGSQSHDRIRGSLDFSKQIRDNYTLVVTYRYFNFNEQEFELDDYQGHFIAIGWRYQF